MGNREIGLLPDSWSIVTRDHRPAAHFEHTIAIRAGKADILSSFEEVEHLEGQNFN
jgi:methionyl aminopeptidase